MRWMVTGGGGRLGYHVTGALARESERGGDQVAVLDRAALDIAEPDALRAVFAEHRPDVVLNCAAYTAVDGAETDWARALRVNAEGPRRLAEACAVHGARLVHVSTNAVFPGDARAPYDEDHPPAPGTAYGRSKLAGEEAVLARLPGAGVVARTAWLYGRRGRSFVSTMIERAAAGETVDVVDDQYGQPSWAGDVAAQLITLGRSPRAHGVFHATNSGEASWYELAREVFRLVGADPGLVRPISDAEYGRAAQLPAYTVLGHGRWRDIGADPPRDWRRALGGALEELLPLWAVPRGSA
ncbi:dTDP-4-dehydrorhamnose reductase [Streptomyces diacarni]|uniref:dTDP-4-dehydrorhamnose reductase n=1 Tax=Streptomyces diacarni TaxID=2800381 RepID=UPI0033C0FC29